MNEPINTTINRELVLEFFLALSKFEFALKTSGYAQGNAQGVSPNWDKFGADLRELFNCECSDEVLMYCEYYLAYPPQKQALEGNYLCWVESPPNKASKIENILILVRRVRNNLFHGGKYNIQAADETERNELLLKGAICILHEAALKIPRVAEAYQNASI